MGRESIDRQGTSSGTNYTSTATTGSTNDSSTTKGTTSSSNKLTKVILPVVLILAFLFAEYKLGIISTVLKLTASIMLVGLAAIVALIVGGMVYMYLSGRSTMQSVQTMGNRSNTAHSGMTGSSATGIATTTQGNTVDTTT